MMFALLLSASEIKPTKKAQLLAHKKIRTARIQYFAQSGFNISGCYFVVSLLSPFSRVRQQRHLEQHDRYTHQQQVLID